MELEIRPEPEAGERAAILAAVERELEPEADPHGSWWHLGVLEALAGGPVAPDERSY